MTSDQVIIALPIEDRRTSCAFYRDGLGFTVPGEPAEDGVPEPLQVELNSGVRVMLIPTGGFGWVLGDRPAAPAGQSECILTIGLDSRTALDQLLERARTAGAEIVTAAGEQPWGYSATFTDPDGHLWQLVAESTVFATTA